MVAHRMFRFLLFTGTGLTLLWTFFSGLLQHSLLLISAMGILLVSKELA